jgi:tRNA 2-selenouridine synthase
LNNSNITAEYYKSLFFEDTPLIDVRAPVEFATGSLPNSVNLPILNDEERALIGTTYKTQGRETAIQLGHQLISGDVKEQRLQAWRSYIDLHPHAVIYCFRGGLRSQITQQWLKEAGIQRPLITGGYKAVRSFIIETIAYY